VVRGAIRAEGRSSPTADSAMRYATCRSAGAN
jgi:hypothetical protein